MPHSDSSTLRAWVEVACVLVAYVVAVPLCLFVALQAVLVFLYGVGVLWEGVPDASQRGPGDGFFMFLVPPIALWLACVVVIGVVAPRLSTRLRERTQARREA